MELPMGPRDSMPRIMSVKHLSTHLTPQNLRLAGAVWKCLIICQAAIHQLTVGLGWEELSRTSSFMQDIRPCKPDWNRAPLVHCQCNHKFACLSLCVALPTQSSGCSWRNPGEITDGLNK